MILLIKMIVFYVGLGSGDNKVSNEGGGSQKVASFFQKVPDPPTSLFIHFYDNNILSFTHSSQGLFTFLSWSACFAFLPFCSSYISRATSRVNLSDSSS